MFPRLRRNVNITFVVIAAVLALGFIVMGVRG
jgi:hypothetical protein